jgi:hypothetical protein
MSRKERLRAIRTRLAALLQDGTLAACGAYPIREGASVSVAGHVGNLLELAIRLERWPADQKRSPAYHDMAAFVVGELERVDVWVAQRALQPEE